MALFSTKISTFFKIYFIKDQSNVKERRRKLGYKNSLKSFTIIYE